MTQHTATDHHQLGHIIGEISGHAVDHLDMSTSPLWTALDCEQPVEQAMLTPIRSNIAAMRTLLDRLETFVNEVESVQGEQEIPAHL